MKQKYMHHFYKRWLVKCIVMFMIYFRIYWLQENTKLFIIFISFSVFIYFARTKVDLNNIAYFLLVFFFRLTGTYF